MPTLDPRIDEHIANAGDFARPILLRFRALVHREIPECIETIKWGIPHFTLRGKNLAGMAAFKAHVSVFFHNDEEPGDTSLFRKIASLDQFPDERLIVERLHGAINRLSCEPKAPKPKAAPKPVPDMPPSFASALMQPGLRDRFDALAPGQRREYIEWIAEAKTEVTREKRITQAVEWIGEGKTRNWKYQKC